MNYNPNQVQLINALIKSKNPQQFVMNMLTQMSQGNPMMETLINLAKENDTAGIEKIARNVVSEKGGDFDKEFNSFRKQTGL
jgi:uncharacterized protein YbaP (TraB family)